MRSTYYQLPLLLKQSRKVGLLGLIVLLHLAFLYALKGGLTHQVSIVAPKDVLVSLITPERAPEPTPAKAAPIPQKIVPSVKKAVSPLPVPLTEAPAPTTVNVPASPPQHAEPAATAISAPTPTVPTPASGPVLPKQITSGIEYIEAPSVSYPSASRRLGEQGSVQFRVLVNTSGKAEKVDIIKSSGFNRLDEEARRAVMRAVFKPYIEDGKPILVSTTGVINFKLDR